MVGVSDSLRTNFARSSTKNRSVANALSFSALASNAVIRVYDEAGNVIATHEQVGEFKQW
jgi:hypothetical protein